MTGFLDRLQPKSTIVAVKIYCARGSNKCLELTYLKIPEQTITISTRGTEWPISFYLPQLLPKLSSRESHAQPFVARPGSQLEILKSIHYVPRAKKLLRPRAGRYQATKDSTRQGARTEHRLDHLGSEVFEAVKPSGLSSLSHTTEHEEKLKPTSITLSGHLI